MNQERMQELIDYKDKPKASQAKRTEFEKLWLEYVREYGFDEVADRYINVGFEYRKMHPFVVYLKESCTPEKILQAFFSGKQFYKNKPKSFKMSLNLLAVMLVEMPDCPELSVPVIKHLPDLSMGKEKKRNPELGKIFDKFFFEELNEKVVLPDLSALGLKDTMFHLFGDLIRDGVRTYNASAKKAESKKTLTDMVLLWVSGDVPQRNTGVCVAVKDPETVGKENPEESRSTNPDADSLKTSKGKDVIAEIKPVEEKNGMENNLPPENVPTWKSGIVAITEAIESLEAERDALNISVMELTDAKAAAEIKLSVASQEKADLEKIRRQLSGELNELNSENCDLKEKIAVASHKLADANTVISELEKTIADKDSEIAARTQLADIVSRDAAKQTDAAMRKLSAELSSYYADFKEAADVEMTAGIGEILRDQLKDIYKILEKHGVTFKK